MTQVHNTKKATPGTAFGEDSKRRVKARQETIQKLKEKLRLDQEDQAELEKAAAVLVQLWYAIKPLEKSTVTEMLRTLSGASVYCILSEIARVVNSIDLLLSETGEYGSLKCFQQGKGVRF